MKKALLVIDMQEDYIEKYSYSLLTCINERIRMAVANKEIIVYVKNTKRLRSGNKTSELAKNLIILSKHAICKESASAFSNPQLEEILEQNQIEEIEIVGVDGNSCIAGTAMDAIKLGYKTLLQLKYIGVQNSERFGKTKESLLEKGVIIV